MKLTQRIRALRLSKLNPNAGPLKYLLSLTEQGFASTLNLATNLWLIRNLDPANYGFFVLATNTALILCNVQSGMTNTHLLTLPPGPHTRPDRAQPERMVLALTLVLAVLSGLILAVALLFFDIGEPDLPLGIALYLPALMLQSYTRALAFSRGLVLSAATQSFAVLVIATSLLGLTWFAGVKQGVDLALVILAIAYSGAASISLLRLCGSLLPQLRLPDLMHFRVYFRDSLWVILGIGSIEILSRFNSVIVSAWYDTAAVGTLGATMLLLRPIGMIISAWSLIGRVAMVEKREAKDWSGFVKTVIQSMAGATAISVPWVLLIYLLWPLISAHLFAGRYADDAGLVLLSGISVIIGVVLFVLSLGFQSLRRFRLLAWADLAGAATAIGVTLILVMLHFSYGWTLVGMMTGQVLDFIILGTALLRLLPLARGGVSGRLVPLKD